MAPRGLGGKKKAMKKTKKNLGMTMDFELPYNSSSVRIVEQEGSIPKTASGSTPSKKGKALASDSGSSSDSAPEELPMITSTNRRNGPNIRKLDALERPDFSAMDKWSSAQFAQFDQYLIKKWELNGMEKKDHPDVRARDQNTKLVRSARKYYRFKPLAIGKTLPSVPKTKPDMSKMIHWSVEDYDSYDLMLINKWKGISGGFDDTEEAAYVRMRGPGSLVFKAFNTYILG